MIYQLSLLYGQLGCIIYKLCSLAFDMFSQSPHSNLSITCKVHVNQTTGGRANCTLLIQEMRCDVL